MIELLVLFSCINGTGCNETATNYYQTNAQLQESVKYAETKVKQKVGERALSYGVPLILAATKHNFVLKMSNEWTLKGEQGCYSVYYTYLF